MQCLSPADVLNLWEVGRSQPLVERALTLLERACPETGRDALARLPLGARDRLLLEVRAQAIGRPLEATAGCPGCGETVEFTLGAEELLEGYPPLGDSGLGGSPPAAEQEMSAAGCELRFRQVDSNDLLAAASCAEVEAARSTLVECCVLAARREGAEVAAAELPAEAVAALAELLAVGDARIETLIDLTCPSCGGVWQTELDPAAFFWEEIRASALELLDEVDVLARAYGWSEAEILALGPARRRLYLERAI